MRTSAKFCVNLYAIALHLYPSAFYYRYAVEMLEAAGHEIAQSRNLPRLTASLLWDTLRCLPRAHWDYATPKSPVLAIVALSFYTVFILFQVVSTRSTGRRSADVMPAWAASQYSKDCSLPALAQSCADKLAAQPRQEIASPSWLNGGRLFVVLYDSAGRAIGGNATLNGNWPQPPHGIFDTIRRRGEFRVTWQPQPGIRVALTGRSLNSGGFVLSGESLSITEEQSARTVRLMFLGWVMMLAIAIPGTIARSRARNRRIATP
jgi:hypothetical protein